MPIDLYDPLMLAPPYNFSAEDDSPAPPVEEDFREALRAFLLALPGLEGLSDVYWSASPPGVSYPFMVVNRLWQRTIIVTTHVYYREAAYQFSVFAMTDTEADSIAQAAHDALLPVGDAEELLFSEGYEMTRHPGGYRGPDSQPQGMIGGDMVWMCSFDYTWIIGLND